MTTRRTMLKSIAAGCAASMPLAAVLPKRPVFPAKYWHVFGDDIQCELCPFGCVLTEGKTGICRTRMNKGQTMAFLGYGYPCAINNDPVEKKPLYHFYPGSLAYSIAVAGCCLRCKNCQNHTISQVSPLETDVPYVSPQDIVANAKSSGAKSIAYTYSEPTVWFEYMFDIAVLARKAGLKNIMVTSGFIAPDPFAELIPYLDAAHIDLKSFDETIYRTLNAGKLQPVLDTITMAHKKGVWIEIVNLVVPQWTDNLAMVRAMCAWIRNTVGPDVPLHFSRFFPLYKLEALVPTPTPVLKKARDIAREEKLRYVYIGNVPEEDYNTRCHECGGLLIERKGYSVSVVGMKGGACRKCGKAVPGVWNI